MVNVYTSFNEFEKQLQSNKVEKNARLIIQHPNKEELRKITDALKSGKCPKGFQIDLMFNGFDAEDAKSIAEALKSGKCPQGFRIDLMLNNFGAKGAKYIAEALNSGKCPQGLYIDLMFSEFGTEGAKYIAEALKSGKCPQGLYIDLSSNRFGTEGAKYIAEALKSGNNPQGLCIDLSDNNISTEYAHKLFSNTIKPAIANKSLPHGIRIEGLPIKREKKHHNQAKKLAETLANHNTGENNNLYFKIPLEPTSYIPPKLPDTKTFFSTSDNFKKIENINEVSSTNKENEQSPEPPSPTTSCCSVM